MKRFGNYIVDSLEKITAVCTAAARFSPTTVRGGTVLSALLSGDESVMRSTFADKGVNYIIPRDFQKQTRIHSGNSIGGKT
jgi:hypothetical protein